MTDYVTLENYKSRVGITVLDKDQRLDEHITAASRRVDAICRRSFAADTGAATARTFQPTNCRTVYIDDAYGITLVETYDDDRPWTTWAATAYETEPANGVGPNGATGWPISVLRAIDDDDTFPTCGRRRTVRVTANWGWPAVPADVVEATYLLTSRLAYEVAVPGGIVPPNFDFGLPGTTLPRPYTAENLLAPYVKPGVMVA